MLTLKYDPPLIAKEFSAGKFVVTKTERKFSGLALDHAHEQNNDIVKNNGGAVGLTGNPGALRRWAVAGPEMARLCNNFEDSVEHIRKRVNEDSIMNRKGVYKMRSLMMLRSVHTIQLTLKIFVCVMEFVGVHTIKFLHSIIS